MPAARDSRDDRAHSMANITKSVSLSVGHADGKNESILLKEARACELDIPNSVHVDARCSHLKNDDSPLTYPSNGSKSNSQAMKLTDIKSIQTIPSKDSDTSMTEGRIAQCYQCLDLSDDREGRGNNLVDDCCSVKTSASDDDLILKTKGSGVDSERVHAQNSSNDRHSSAECKDLESSAAEIAEGLAKEEWIPAQVHVGKVCEAMPAPHHSDGGISVQEIDEPEWKKKRGRSKLRNKKLVRMPNTRDRARARQEGRVQAYGIRGEGTGYVCLDREDAMAKKGVKEVRMFDASADVSRNIRMASKWVRQEQNQEKDVSTLSGRDAVQQEEKIERVKWNISAAPFCPRVASTSCWKDVKYDTEQGPTLTRKDDQNGGQEPDISLRDLLRHPQVSNVRDVTTRVQQRMDGFKKCGHDTWRLDLRGTTAGQIQRKLRIQLVEDLRQGSDEAAFVCKQLGIDSVPRADQLELMIAAMPGVAKLELKGTPAKSGLSMADWRELHATHCSKGCTKDEINEECYFRIIHHFLLCGFDPELCKGCSWEDFKTKHPAYVDMWRGDEERCRAAWKKWTEGSGGLMSESVLQEPDFSVPILPATRSKHKWRYLKYGVPYKVRLCLDLKAAKVNASTEDWKFRYKALDDIAASVKKGDWLASVDISRFYLRLPAGKKLRGVQWVQDPESYAHTARLNNKSKRKRWRQLNAIGFGLKTAPAWASVVSAELVRILKQAGVRVVGCFIDDLLIAGATQELCQQALDKAMSIMQRLGLPANEKTVLPRSPDKGIVFLGVHIRTADMRFTISEEHRTYAMDRVSTVLEQGTATKADLASIAGVLNWISFVFIPGRPRRQIIYDAARLGVGGKKKDVVKLEGALLRQLQWWRSALKSSNFVGSRVWDMQASPKTMLIRSDASGEDGWGACAAGFHFVGPWPSELQEEHMLFKEIVPVTIMIALLSGVLSETVFGVAVDNTGVAFAVNKLSCRDRITLRMLQQITSDLDKGGHTVLGAHIRRHRNTHTDAMSHALLKFMWNKITESFKHGRRVQNGGYWIFPFVAQKLSTGECVSGSFKMRRSLFARIADVSNV